jgi:spore coat protein A
MMGTNVAAHAATHGSFFGRFLDEPASEVVYAGATEVWEIFNLTGDTHPIHFHLVNVQIINRQPFDPAQFPNPVFLGPARVPDLNERGWKETVRMNPGEVTRVVMKFDLPHVPFTLPNSDRACPLRRRTRSITSTFITATSWSMRNMT